MRCNEIFSALSIAPSKCLPLLGQIYHYHWLYPTTLDKFTIILKTQVAGGV